MTLPRGVLMVLAALLGWGCQGEEEPAERLRLFGSTREVLLGDRATVGLERQRGKGAGCVRVRLVGGGFFEDSEPASGTTFTVSMGVGELRTWTVRAPEEVGVMTVHAERVGPTCDASVCACVGATERGVTANPPLELRVVRVRTEEPLDAGTTVQDTGTTAQDTGTPTEDTGTNGGEG